MRVRQKLLVTMAVLILLMSGAFFTISRYYFTGLFRQYAAAARQGEVNQWENILVSYYQQNNNSWVGVNQYLTYLNDVYGNTLVEPGHLEYVVLYDKNGQLIVGMGDDPNAISQAKRELPEVDYPLKVNGNVIGKLAVWDRGMAGLYKVEQTVEHSATLATVWGTILTAFLALLVGVWWSGKVTKPLKHMIQGLRKISSGDLQTKLTVESADEFGEVAKAFNDMSDTLAKTEEARRHLVADVAHELRIPLTVMQGQLELIQQGVKPAAPETLLPIQDEVFRLTRLVQDLHQLTLAEVGKLSLVMQPTRIDHLLHRIIDHFSFEFEDQNIHIQWNNELQESDEVSVDPDRITQVFVNLFGNALRYTPKEGTITVTLRSNVSAIEVAVSDKGPGISQAHVDHVFDRFYRADEDRSRGTGGTGLGLAIAKEFVEAHGGTISVQSKLGEGTTFLVQLPRRMSLNGLPDQRK